MRSFYCEVIEVSLGIDPLWLFAAGMTEEAQVNPLPELPPANPQNQGDGGNTSTFDEGKIFLGGLAHTSTQASLEQYLQQWYAPPSKPRIDRDKLPSLGALHHVMPFENDCLAAFSS